MQQNISADTANLIVDKLKLDQIFSESVMIQEQPANLPPDVLVTVIVMTGPFVIINVIYSEEHTGIDLFVNPLNGASSTAHLVSSLHKILPDMDIQVVGVCAPIIEKQIISYDPEVVYEGYNKIMSKVQAILMDEESNREVSD